MGGQGSATGCSAIGRTAQYNYTIDVPGNAVRLVVFIATFKMFINPTSVQCIA
jgi:hypothetical protein